MQTFLDQLMPIFIIAFGVFLLFFVLMALGLLQKKPLKGSCGGVANLMGDDKCQFCGGDVNKCQTSNDRATL